MRLSVLRLEDRLTPVAYTWTGGTNGQGTIWTSPANWSPMAVPGPGDTAAVTTNGPAITGVGGTLIAVNSIRPLTTGANLTLTGSSSSFAVTNPAGLTITALGTLTLGTNSSNGGTLQNAAGQSLNLTVPTNFINAGTLTLGSLSTLSINGFTNAAGGLVTLNDMASLSGSTFSNAGTFTTNSTNAYVLNGFTNSGFANLNVLSRTINGLTLNGGAVGQVGGTTLTLTGNNAIAAGAALNATGLVLLNATLGGSGSLNQPAGSTTTLNGATLGVPFANAGTLTVRNDQTPGGSGQNALNATSSNAGSLTVVGSGGVGSQLVLGGAFTNTGAFTLTTANNSPQIVAVTGGGSFTNLAAGTVRAQGLARAEINGGTFANQGTTQIDAGVSLWIGTGMTNAGTVTFGGTGSVLNYPNGGNYTQSAGSTNLGPSGQILNANVAVTAGTFTGAGTTGPSLAASGTTSVTPGGTGTGRIEVLGSASLTGAYAVQLNGTTAATQYDQVTASGFVTVGGTLTVTTGFTPTAGDVFRVIDNLGGSPVSGTFAGLPEGATLTVGGQSFRVSYVGGTGNDVTLTVPSAATAPRVSGVAVNAGQTNTTQRSRVTSLTVTFSAQVTFAGPIANGFIVSRLTGGSVGGFTATANVVGGVTVVTLTGFTGAQTEFGSLADGRYVVTVLANQVSANGLQLDGDGNGTGGDNYTLTGSTANGLFRLFGDANGDGSISGGDFGTFRLAFGTVSGDSAYVAWLDFDGNGSISGGDFGNFRVRFGTTVP